MRPNKVFIDIETSLYKLSAEPSEQPNDKSFRYTSYHHLTGNLGLSRGVWGCVCADVNVYKNSGFTSCAALEKQTICHDNPNFWNNFHMFLPCQVFNNRSIMPDFQVYITAHAHTCTIMLSCEAVLHILDSWSWFKMTPYVTGWANSTLWAQWYH